MSRLKLLIVPLKSPRLWLSSLLVILVLNSSISCSLSVMVQLSLSQFSWSSQTYFMISLFLISISSKFFWSLQLLLSISIFITSAELTLCWQIPSCFSSLIVFQSESLKSLVSLAFTSSRSQFICLNSSFQSSNPLFSSFRLCSCSLSFANQSLQFLWHSKEVESLSLLRLVSGRISEKSKHSASAKSIAGITLCLTCTLYFSFIKFPCVSTLFWNQFLGFSRFSMSCNTLLVKVELLRSLVSLSWSQQAQLEMESLILTSVPASCSLISLWLGFTNSSSKSNVKEPTTKWLLGLLDEQMQTWSLTKGDRYSLDLRFRQSTILGLSVVSMSETPSTTLHFLVRISSNWSESQR